MSMCVLGLSGELNPPASPSRAVAGTTIATAAVGNLLGGDAMMRASRTPEIMGDAPTSLTSLAEFTGQSASTTGTLQWCQDFEPYRSTNPCRLMSTSSCR